MLFGEKYLLEFVACARPADTHGAEEMCQEQWEKSLYKYLKMAKGAGRRRNAGPPTPYELSERGAKVCYE